MENLQPSNCITLDELQQLLDNKTLQVKIIDVRSKEEYNESHIPGAINIAILDIELVNNHFDKTDFIITACGKGGGRSTQAAEKLQELGFKNSIWLCGGTFGWIQK